MIELVTPTETKFFVGQKVTMTEEALKRGYQGSQNQRE